MQVLVTRQLCAWRPLRVPSCTPATVWTATATATSTGFRRLSRPDGCGHERPDFDFGSAASTAASAAGAVATRACCAHDTCLHARTNGRTTTTIAVCIRAATAAADGSKYSSRDAPSASSRATAAHAACAACVGSMGRHRAQYIQLAAADAGGAGALGRLGVRRVPGARTCQTRPVRVARGV